MSPQNRRTTNREPRYYLGTCKKAALLAFAAIAMNDSAFAETIASNPASNTGAGESTSNVLRDIEFSPSAYLDEQDLAIIKARYIGQPLTKLLAEAIQKDVTAAYAAKDVALAKAIIGKSDLSTGTLVIELFEAKFGELNFNSKIASDRYYRWRLGVNSGDVADNRLLDKRLRRLALTDQVVFDAQMSPGKARGQTDLTINTNESEKFVFDASINNYGSAAGSRERALLSFRINGLTRANDPLVLTASPSKDSPYVGLSYARFIGRDGTVLSISGGYDRSFRTATVKLLSESVYGEVALAKPLILDEQTRVFLSGQVQYFWDQSKLFDVPFLEQNGGLGSIGLSANLRRGNTTIAINPAFRLARYRSDLAGTELTHLALVGDATISNQIAKATYVSVRGGGQLALQNVAPFRNNITIASPYAVRGYPTGLQLGDSGYYVRSQLERRIENFGTKPKGAMTPFIFLDFGEAFDRVGGSHVGQEMLMSAGIGASVELGNRVRTELFLAKPLKNTPTFDKHDVFHFAFTATLRL